MKFLIPHSDNVIFYDGEFTSLNPYTGELLSVGMVKPNGEELYLEIEAKGEVSEWDKEHVLPYLSGNYISRKEAKKRITQFLGNDQPYLVCFVPQYDMVFLHKLFNVGDEEQGDLPYHWMPIDLASILFARGMNPHHLSEEGVGFLETMGLDPASYRKHNALDDAKLVRDVYFYLVKKDIE